MGQERLESRGNPDRMKKRVTYIALAALVLAGGIWSIYQVDGESSNPQGTTQESSGATAEQKPWHKGIYTTVFWVGEPADESNANISNAPSAWTADWQAAFGGTDDPKKRCEWNPCGFQPKENTFYFALPYNDREGGRTKSAAELERIPWYTGGQTPDVSWVKNRWIEVEHDNKRAYAQWEDVGPMNEDDIDYVFGDAQPKFAKSGLDLSPATTDYLQLNGLEQVSWRFVDAQDVPDGPWKTVVTTSPAEY